MPCASIDRTLRKGVDDPVLVLQVDLTGGARPLRVRGTICIHRARRARRYSYEQSGISGSRHEASSARLEADRRVARSPALLAAGRRRRSTERPLLPLALR